MQKITDVNILPDIEKQSGISLIKLSAGNTLVVDQVVNELKLFSRNLQLQLAISIKEEGLIVNIDASQLNINSTNEINLKSKKINIEASEQINIKTSGNLVQEVGKDCLTEISGTNKNIAQVQKITASLGNIDMKANDDVRLDGESVKLNCDD